MNPSSKHRSSGTSKPRGVAALVIGGLVAGTVAAAGATTFNSADVPSVAKALTADLSLVADGDATPETETPESSPAPATEATAVDRGAALANLRSASLSELRDSASADRSEARAEPQAAPDDAQRADSVLASSSFTGYTPEPEPTAEVASESAGAGWATTSSNQGQSGSQQGGGQQAAPAPAPIGGGVVGIARQYVGYPYVLPGNPPSTFDCSSFTWWVYQQAGISIPRTVNGQKAAVTPVSNPQPGDLVFTSQYHHVGLYAGNGMVIEALNPGRGVTYGAPVYGGVWYGRLNG